MDIAIATRSVADVALAGALVGVAVTLDDQRYPATPARKTELSPRIPALDAELARCKAIGAEAANDVVCKAVWDANRQRFLQSNALQLPPKTWNN